MRMPDKLSMRLAFSGKFHHIGRLVYSAFSDRGRMEVRQDKRQHKAPHLTFC